DVKVRVDGGGLTGQAGAIRLGVARALLQYDPELRRILRERGLLTRDPREVERKKPGQPGARKRFQFSKRKAGIIAHAAGRRAWVPAGRLDGGRRWKINPTTRGVVHEGSAAQGPPGGGGPFRAPDEPLEPEDASLHLRGTQRHSHHRSQEDTAGAAAGAAGRARRDAAG